MSEKLLPCPVIRNIPLRDGDVLGEICINCPNITQPDYEALAREVEALDIDPWHQEFIDGFKQGLDKAAELIRGKAGK